MKYFVKGKYSFRLQTHLCETYDKNATVKGEILSCKEYAHIRDIINLLINN